MGCVLSAYQGNQKLGQRRKKARSMPMAVPKEEAKGMMSTR